MSISFYFSVQIQSLHSSCGLCLEKAFSFLPSFFRKCIFLHIPTGKMHLNRKPNKCVFKNINVGNSALVESSFRTLKISF